MHFKSSDGEVFIQSIALMMLSNRASNENPLKFWQGVLWKSNIKKIRYFLLSIYILSYYWQKMPPYFLKYSARQIICNYKVKNECDVCNIMMFWVVSVLLLYWADCSSVRGINWIPTTNDLVKFCIQKNLFDLMYWNLRSHGCGASTLPLCYSAVNTFSVLFSWDRNW